MTDNIAKSAVIEFSTSVNQLAQQMKSQAFDKVMVTRGHRGKKVEATKQVGISSMMVGEVRHGDTVIGNIDHLARWMTFETFSDAQLLGIADTLQTNVNFLSSYLQSMSLAYARVLDKVVVDAVLTDNALTGEQGNISTPFNPNNIVAVTEGSGTTQTGLNQGKLVKIEEIIYSSGIDMSEKIYVGITARQRRDLQGIEQVTNIDYNSIKPLATGTIQSWSNLIFVPMEGTSTMDIIPKDSVTGYRQLPCWTKSSIELGIQEDFSARVDLRTDKQYDTQLYVRGRAGATRLEESLVGMILCNEENN